MSRFQNAGAYEDNIPVIQSVNNFKIGDAIAPLTITLTGSTIYSTLVVNSFSTMAIPPGTRPIESTHIFHPSLPAGTFIQEQLTANTFRLSKPVSTINGITRSTLTGNFSYLSFVPANLSSYVSSANAIGVVTNTNLPSFQIISTVSGYSSTIIKPFAYKAFGEFYKTIPVSTFSLSSLTGIQIGSQVAINYSPINVPPVSINDQFIVTTRDVSTITWLYLGQDTLTGEDTGILNPFVGGGAAGGAGGGNNIYNDTWFLSNTAAAPAAPKSFPFPGAPSTVVSATDIVLPWVYPEQFTVGYSSNQLPFLSSLHVTLTCMLSTGNTTMPISTLNTTLVGGANTNLYINQIAQNTAMTAVILQTRNSTPPSTIFSTIGYPAFSTPTNVMIIRNGLFSTISSSLTSNSLKVWYDNYVPGSNVTTIPFYSTFAPPGGPGNFTSVTAIVPTTSSVTISLVNPTYTDAVNRTNTSILTAAVISVATTVAALPARAGPAGATIAALPVTSPLLNATTTVSPANPASIVTPDAILNAGQNVNIGPVTTVVAPGTPYTFTVATINDQGIASPSVALNVTTFTTPPVPLGKTPAYFSTPILMANESFRYCSTTIPIYNISTNSTVTNLLSTTTDWVSGKIQTPLTPLYGQANAPYGQTFYNVAIDINSTITTPGTSFVRPGTSVVTSSGQQGWNASGWPADTFTSTLVTTNGINLRVSSIDTYYFAPVTYQGFYYSASVDFTISTTAFNSGSLLPSPTPLQVNMRQYATTQGATAETTSGKSLTYGTSPSVPNAISSSTFYYNGKMQMPILSGVSTSIVGAPQYASGVSIIGNGAATLSISTYVSSLGGFFYTPPMVQYKSELFTHSDIKFNDFLSTVGPNIYKGANFNERGPIPDNLMFSFQENLNVTASSYTSSLAISTILNNPIGTTSKLVDVFIMIDSLSISTIATIPTTIPLMSVSDRRGALVKLSTISPFSLCTPYDTGVPVIYDHIQNISTGATALSLDYRYALQITNGSFTSGSYSKYAYANYASTLGNTGVTYGKEGIVPTGNTFRGQVTVTPTDKYRFAKFAWKLVSNIIVNGISIQINNLRNALPTNYGKNGFTVFGLPYTDQMQPPVVIFYRFSDQTSGGVINGTTYSTPWTSATNVISTPDAGNTFEYIAQSPSQDPTLNSYENEVISCGVSNPGDVPFTYANNTLNIPVYPPANGVTSVIVVPPIQAIYFYVLIGLPMSYDIAFDSVSAFYF